MKSAIAVLAALPLVPFAFAAHAASPAPAPATSAARAFEAAIPATSLKAVKLGIAVGNAHIKTGRANTVRIHVTARPGGHGHFIFNWTTGNESTNGLPRDLHLVAKKANGTLLLCLASATGSGCTINPAAAASGANTTNVNVMLGPDVDIHTGGPNLGWTSNWTITLPARLALKLELGVGDAEVHGVGGGANVQIGVGHLNAKLPRGPLTATIGVGHVEAAVGSPDYGKVDLSAGVGQVSFSVHGRELHSGYEHHVTSSSQTLTGPGTTAYTLQTGVGHIELKLGVAGLPSLPPNVASAPQATSASAPASQTKPAVPASAPQTATMPVAAIHRL